jgi:hypothetical protein
MPTSLPRTPLAGFGTAVVLVILANLVFYWLLEEVNRKRAAGDQISRFFVNARAFEIIRLHNEFYPESSKRAVLYFCACIGIGLGFLTFVLFASTR